MALGVYEAMCTYMEGDSAASLKRLREIVAQAREYHLLMPVMRTRMVIARYSAETGDLTEAKALVPDAEQAGFLNIARIATGIVEAGGARPPRI